MVGCSLEHDGVELLELRDGLDAYRDRGSFPGADRAFARALALPFASTMTEAECDRVAAALARFV